MTVTGPGLLKSYSQVIHRTKDGPCPLTILKKILILTTRATEREELAATNVSQALMMLAQDKIQVEVVDLQRSCDSGFEGLLGLRFKSTVRTSLRDLLRSWEPDVVVSLSLFCDLLIREIYQGGRQRDFVLISQITEMEIDAAAWRRSASDYFAVITRGVAEQLVLAGVPEKKVKVFGFPVLAALENEEGTPGRRVEPGCPRVLYLVNTARKKSLKLLDRLLENPAWKITVSVESHTALEVLIKERTASAPDRLRVILDFQNLPALLRSHDVVISRAGTAITQEAVAARCPLIVPKVNSRVEESNLELLRQANAGALAEKPRAVVDWLERAFRDGGSLLSLWEKNLEHLGPPDGGKQLARFILDQASRPQLDSGPEIRALPPPPKDGSLTIMPLRQLRKRLLLCDFHTHTTWSDGKLDISEIVDFYGKRGFDCLCITDHLCDPNRLLGKLVNLSGMVIAPDKVADYFEAIEREKRRAWAQYDLLLMTGLEFNKDGYTPKTSAHLLGIDLKQPIDPSLDIRELIMEIHAQGALAIASHPHETKSNWGKDTLYLWEHVDEYAPMIDAWEVANRDDIFNPIGLKKLPFIANSDFHKPKHIHSWKSLVYCEKEPEAIKHCIRVNRDVSLTLYRDQGFNRDERQFSLASFKDRIEPVEESSPLFATGTRL